VKNHDDEVVPRDFLHSGYCWVRYFVIRNSHSVCIPSSSSNTLVLISAEQTIDAVHIW
jgi:hypothetical protein